MAKQPDIYVEIAAMAAKKSDLKVKLTKLPAIMSKAAADYFKKESGFTTKKPKDKNDPAFKVSGNVTSLKKQKKGKNELIMCTVSFVLSRLSDDALASGKLEGIGGVSASNDLQGDAEFAVATATKEAGKVAVKQMKHTVNKK